MTLFIFALYDDSILDECNKHDDSLIVAGQYVKWFVILMYFGYGSYVLQVYSNCFTWAWNVA